MLKVVNPPNASGAAHAVDEAKEASSIFEGAERGPHVARPQVLGAAESADEMILDCCRVQCRNQEDLTLGLENDGDQIQVWLRRS